jgi:hypothetical protein
VVTSLTSTAPGLTVDTTIKVVLSIAGNSYLCINDLDVMLFGDKLFFIE